MHGEPKTVFLTCIGRSAELWSLILDALPTGPPAAQSPRERRENWVARFTRLEDFGAKPRASY